LRAFRMRCRASRLALGGGGARRRRPHPGSRAPPTLATFYFCSRGQRALSCHVRARSRCAFQSNEVGFAKLRAVFFINQTKKLVAGWPPAPPPHSWHVRMPCRSSRAALVCVRCFLGAFLSKILDNNKCAGAAALFRRRKTSLKGPTTSCRKQKSARRS
jgi:hypothetical protein